MSQNPKHVTIVMVEDDEGHARLIEKNIRRAGVTQRDHAVRRWVQRSCLSP